MQWHLRALAEIAGERPPSNGYIDLVRSQGFNQARRWIRLVIGAMNAEAMQIVDDAARCQCHGGRHAAIVITDRVDANAQLAQARIVEGPDLKPAVGAG